MEILSDATFRGEVNFNKNATFANGTVLKFQYRGSFDGNSLVATEFVYPIGPEQGRFREVDGNGNTLGTYYFPTTQNLQNTEVISNTLALISQIGQVAKQCRFIQSGDTTCMLSYRDYVLDYEITADCTLFSIDVSNFGVESTNYVADVELFKKEQIPAKGCSSVEVLSKVNADILIGNNDHSRIYIRKASTYPIEANTHTVKLIGITSVTYC